MHIVWMLVHASVCGKYGVTGKSKVQVVVLEMISNERGLR